MPRSPFVPLTVICVLALTAGSPASALILGGDDDRPLDMPGWPTGAAEIFNVPERVAYWEGPPFGGGQYHAECRGDTDALNQVLAKFAQLENKTKRVIVEDGVGSSFWLNPNNEADKRKRARIDWRFMVWIEQNWQQLKDMPADLNPTNPDDRGEGPPTELTIYTSGNIAWDQVELPEGMELVDNRMASHGFTPDDGWVAQGTVKDASTGAAVEGKVWLEDIDPQTKEGNQGRAAAEVTTDAQGNWTLKNMPQGWYQVVADSEGYLPRIIGYVKPTDQPKWQRLDATLAKGGKVAGRVTQADGTRLEAVRVRLRNTAPGDGSRYRSPEPFETTTNDQGEFELMAPVGSASLSIYKDGWVRPGLGPEISVPAESVDLQMVRSSQVTVLVQFETTDVPGQYMVQLEPEGGNVVGSWGGSSSIDDANQCSFKNIPPGRYQLWGHPNPHSEGEESPRIQLDLQGGEELLKTIKVAE